MAQVLRSLQKPTDPNVVSGYDGHSDSAIYRVADNLAIVQSVDYITPIVDDPYQFGAIAAANALSDLYAIGARPVIALNLVGFPAKTLPLSVLNEIMRGGADKIIEAGASVLGGHSIDDHEPKYGLAVTGLINPDKRISNIGAKPGDTLLLTKPLGTGIVATAIDRKLAGSDLIERLTAQMSQLNREAAAAMLAAGVHACTDVSGFGLLGHLREMAAASGVGARANWKAVPVLDAVWDLIRQDCIPDGTQNNLDYLTGFVDWSQDVPEGAYTVLCDAQTSGGLLMAVPPEKSAALLAALAKTATPGEVIGEIIPAPRGQIQVIA